MADHDKLRHLFFAHDCGGIRRLSVPMDLLTEKSQPGILLISSGVLGLLEGS